MISNPGGEALYNAYQAMAQALQADADREEPNPDECACDLHGPKPYLLELEYNSVSVLKCVTCGKPVKGPWIDDALSTKVALPVTVAWTSDPGDGYVTEPDFYGEISPRTEACDGIG